MNLAHVLRKKRHYREAEQHYLTALSFAPAEAGTLAALAFTCLLQVVFGGLMNDALALLPIAAASLTAQWCVLVGELGKDVCRLMPPAMRAKQPCAGPCHARVRA